MTQVDNDDQTSDGAKPSPIETALSYKAKTEAAIARIFHFGWVWVITLIAYKLASWAHLTFNIPIPNWSEPGFSLFGHLVELGVSVLIWVPSLVVRPMYEWAGNTLDAWFSLSPPSFDAVFRGWREAALVSIILSRVLDASYIFVPLSDREAARNSMTPSMRNEIRSAEGAFGKLHFLADWLNGHIYSARDWLSVRATTLSRNVLRLRPPRHFVAGPGRLNNKIANRTLVFLISDLCAALFFWGYVKAMGYSVAVLTTLRLTTPQPRVWRQTVYMFFLNLLIAALVAFLFYVTDLAAITETTAVGEHADRVSTTAADALHSTGLLLVIGA